MNKQAKFYDFSQYNLAEQVKKTDCVGWNGSSIKTYPFYELFNNTRLSLEELKKLKLYDIILFDKENYFETYLVIPLKVSSQYVVEFKKEINEDNKQFLLNFSLLKCVDDNDKYLFIPPEGIPAIEKNGIHFFDAILEYNEMIQGIIMDNYYLKQFEHFQRSVQDVSNFEFERLLIIKFSEHNLCLTDSHDELNTLFNKKKILIPSIKSSDKMNNIQIIDNIIKGLPKNRPTPYQKGMSLKLNASSSEMKESKSSSKKKDELIEENKDLKKQIETLQLKIQELETQLGQTKEITTDKTIIFLENMIQTIQNHIQKKK